MLSILFLFIFATSFLFISESDCAGTEPKRKEKIIEKSTAADIGGGQRKILLAADNKSFSHFNLMINLVNNSKEPGNIVHFLILDIRGVEKDVEELAKFRARLADGIHPIFVEPDQQLEHEFFAEREKSKFSTWTHSYYSTQMEFHWSKMGYSAIALFHEVVKDHQLLNWLQNKNYNLGIAENRDLGALALFQEIGIKTTIATVATHLMPAFMHFLGLPMLDTVPEHYSGGADVGVIGLLKDPKMREKNASEYRRTIGQWEEEYEKVHTKYYLHRGHGNIPKLPELFRRVRFVLVNACERWLFGRPTLPKIRLIGGIGTQMKLFSMKFSRGHKQQQIGERLKKHRGSIHPSILDAKCIIIFALGSNVKLDDFSRHHLDAMLHAFDEVNEKRANKCHFIVKIPESSIRYGQIGRHPFVHRMDWIPQQELLALESARVFISHCGLNSLIESLFGGVPIVCLPFFSDQRYNASIAEYLQFGIWLKPTEFIQKFQKTLKHIVEERKYRRNAIKIAKSLHLDPNSAREVFKETIEYAMAESEIENSSIGIGKRSWEESEEEEDGQNKKIKLEEEMGGGGRGGIETMQNIPGAGMGFPIKPVEIDVNI